MSAEIVNTADGILTVRVSGKITQPEFRAVQAQAGLVLQKQNQMGILILSQDFEGWDWKTGDWQDKSWQKENDKFISKLAIVGEKKWEELGFMFISAREFPVEYFQPGDVAKAREWLAQTS